MSGNYSNQASSSNPHGWSACHGVFQHIVCFCVHGRMANHIPKPRYPTNPISIRLKTRRHLHPTRNTDGNCPGRLCGWTNVFPDTPCMKKACMDDEASVHCSTTRNEEWASSRPPSACQPVVKQSSCSPIRFTWDFLYSFFRRKVQDGCLRLPWRSKARGCPWPNRSAFAPPRLALAAASCPAPPRFARGCQVFWSGNSRLCLA